MRKNSMKNERINHEVQRELSNIIRKEVKDPRIPTLISVTDVQVAPDLKTCKAYISVLGDEQTVAVTHEVLRRAAGFIRSRLAANLNMRNTPQLTFIMDQSIEYGIAMSAKIDEVMKGVSSDEQVDDDDAE